MKRIAMVSLAVVASAHGQDLTPVSGLQSTPVVILHAEAHPMSGPPVMDSAVWFDEGRIVRVMTAEQFAEMEKTMRWKSPGPTRIDATGKRLYPGMFGAVTQLGLTEMASTRATNDLAEVGPMGVSPEARAVTAVNPDSTLIPVTRSNGVLTAGVLPLGGLLPGRGGVIRLHGWTVNDLTVLGEGALVVNWPAERVPEGLDDKLTKDIGEQIAKAKSELARVFDDAALYAQERRTNQKRSVDLRLSAVAAALPAPTKDASAEMPAPIPVFVNANDVDQITAAVAFFAGRGIKCVIVGGRDAALCVEILKKHDVAVAVDGMHRLPKRFDAPIDANFKLPALLRAAGVRFCIASGEETAHERNLPYAAARSAAYGLDAEDAMRAITLWPAEIWGVGDRLGSLQEGRAATLILTDGSPLEIRTRVLRAWVDGREVDLSNKQTALYEKFLEKYRQRGELKENADPARGPEGVPGDGGKKP